MDLRKKYRDACETLGWSLTDEGDGNIYVNQPSPKGEDFGFSVPAADFVRAVRDYYQDFDVDEHVEMWLEARKSGVQGIPSSIRELVKDAEDIDDMLKELAETLEDKEREQVNIELDALTTPGADIRPEGMVLEVDDREVYADFLGCDMEALDTDRMDGPTEYLLEDVTFRDKKGGEEILLGEDELRYAALKAVRVRCDREEGLYFQPDSITITAQGPDSRLHQVMHDNSDRSPGHVDVHAADHGGNDWPVSDHKPDHKPGLDDLIKGAEGRAAAQDGKEQPTVGRAEQEH